MPAIPQPESPSGQPRPVLVGFSGGLDSSVLLHLLAGDPGIRAVGLRAIHVHHGLHPDADAWMAHCAGTCAALDVPLQVVHVKVDLDAGLGMEGAARDARHRAFAAALREGETLALAHHRDDQAETFLLRALRGSGVDGLAAMTPWRAYAQGWLWRPFLQVGHARLRAYADTHALRWINDPGNAGDGPDRNFLRNRVLPLLRERWPHADAAFARSAQLADAASGLLTDTDDALLASLQDDDRNLRIDALRELPGERRGRVLRRWIEGLGLPPLPSNGIERIDNELLCAAKDAEARFDWHGARVQRWRYVLHAETIRDSLPADWSQHWDGSAPLALPTGDTLELAGADCFDAPLRVHARHGGERIVLPKRDHSHALKHVLQDTDMPPWQRGRLPLLSDGAELLAAGDAILSARMDAWLRERDARLRWIELA